MHQSSMCDVSERISRPLLAPTWHNDPEFKSFWGGVRVGVPRRTRDKKSLPGRHPNKSLNLLSVLCVLCGDLFLS
jgi:hypothetical protein